MKMWFMMIVKASKGCEAGKGDIKTLPPAIRKFNEEMRKAGVLVELSRLHPSSKGARIKFSGGKQSVTDGPFAETKEQIGGYWIIQVESKEEAIEWAKRVPVPDGENAGASAMRMSISRLLIRFTGEERLKRKVRSKNHADTNQIRAELGGKSKFPLEQARVLGGGNGVRYSLGVCGGGFRQSGHSGEYGAGGAPVRAGLRKESASAGSRQCRIHSSSFDIQESGDRRSTTGPDF
jgi:hypothetical protein